VGKRSREKGAQAERAAARILQVIYPDAQRRVSGEEGQGENLGRDLKGTPGLCVQVKEMGSPTPLAALDQAICAAAAGEIPVAFVRQARKGRSTPFRVVMPLGAFLVMLAACRGIESPGFTVDDHLKALSAADDNLRARIVG